MEYLAKSEVMQYLDGYRKQLALEGKSTSEITDIMHNLNAMYTYRPLLQSQWIKKRDTISCSKCGFMTMIYKNTKYCPNCGRQMVNGKKND